MSASKYFNMIVAAAMAAAVFFTSLLYYLSGNQKFVEAMSYQAAMPYEEMFDQFEILQVEIELTQEDWEDILANPLAEEYKPCDVRINGTLYTDLAVRTKGNTSLSQVASSDSIRYSFKLEFDHYDGNKTWNGLDKLVLNNLYCDAAYVKEYMAYDIFRAIGVAVPYYAFADIQINGADFGCYLALEAVEDSFLQRVYSASGKLYKPESVSFGGGGRGKMPPADGSMTQTPGEAGENMQKAFESAFREPFDKTSAESGGIFGEAQEKPAAERKERGGQIPEITSDLPSDAGVNGMPPEQNFVGGEKDLDQASGKGADLKYTDDNISSYSEIFDNAVFDSSDEDKKRVITALKKLSDGEELEKYIDVDACLRYFAAQTFLVNLDSYYSILKHNYYLYENNGQLTILPWDLNLAFGGFQCRDADEAVNSAIDTPMQEELLKERPLFGQLMENEEYQKSYHDYLNRIVEDYVGGGQFTATLSKITSLIAPYVKKDATSFYNYEEFVTAADLLKAFVLLRSESVSKQLNGEIPSRDSERDENTSLVDASFIDLKAMGVQGSDGAGGKGNIDGNMFGGLSLHGRSPMIE